MVINKDVAFYTHCTKINNILDMRRLFCYKFYKYSKLPRGSRYRIIFLEGKNK